MPDVVAEVIETVRRLLKNGPVSVGQIAFIGLGDLRTEMGPEKWEKFSPAIRRYTEAALKDHCTEADSFIRCSDDQYLIIFSNCSAEAAEVRAAAIGSRILREVHGQEGLEGVRVFSCAESLSDLGHPDGHTPEEVIQRFRERSRVAGTSEKPVTSMAVERAGRRARLRRSLAHPNDSPLQYLFNPYLHTKSRRVATFRCSARKDFPRTGKTLTDYEIFGPDLLPEELIQFDIDLLEEALLALTFAIRHGHRTHLVVQLHFETVASQTGQMQLREVLEFVPAPLRSLLSFNLAAVPLGVPESRLAGISNFLHSFGSHLSVDLETGLTMDAYRELLNRLAGAGVHFISYRLPSKLSETAVKDACAVMQTASQNRLGGALRNLRDISLEPVLVKAGYEYITGAAIGLPTASIPAPWRFELMDET